MDSMVLNWTSKTYCLLPTAQNQQVTNEFSYLHNKVGPSDISASEANVKNLRLTVLNQIPSEILIRGFALMKRI